MRSPPSSAAEKEVTAVFRARPDSMPNIERLYADNSMPEANSDVKRILWKSVLRYQKMFLRSPIRLQLISSPRNDLNIARDVP